MFETFESLPESTTTVKSGKYGPFNQTKREAQTRWVLNPDAEGPQVVVDLTTSHSPESKAYRTTLTWGTVERVERHPADGPGVASIYTWASDHAYVRLLNERTERYSVKGLSATHSRMLAWLEAEFTVIPEFFGVFVEAAEANGLVGQEA